MSDLAHRIRQRLDDLGLSQKELADSCGISAPAVNDWLSGKTKSLKAATLLKAAKALAVNPQWLESGVGLKSSRHQMDPVTQQLQRLIEHMLLEDQRKLLEYAEMLALKRLHEQKKQRVTTNTHKS
jgi:transcriptional regulator with XRE-family HTH domain